MSEPDFGIGFQTPSTAGNKYNALEFIISQIINRDVRVATPVKVLSVTDGGAVGDSVVSVQPLINQVDGQGNATPHGEIFNVPVWRYSCAFGAIICDPSVGDVGALIIFDRDASSVQATRGQQSNPGSSRKYDLADGVFFGRLYGGPVNQYIQLASTGINIADMNGNVMKFQPGGIAVTAEQFTVNGLIIGGFGTPDQVGLQTHTHPANGSPPTPGT